MFRTPEKPSKPRQDQSTKSKLDTSKDSSASLLSKSKTPEVNSGLKNIKRRLSFNSKKKGKSDKELIILRYHFHKTKREGCLEDLDMPRICEETGFTRRQVYKWMWDEKRRESKANDQGLEDEIWELHERKYKKLKVLEEADCDRAFVLGKIHVPGRLGEIFKKGVLKDVARSKVCWFDALVKQGKLGGQKSN